MNTRHDSNRFDQNKMSRWIKEWVGSNPGWSLDPREQATTLELDRSCSRVYVYHKDGLEDYEAAELSNPP